MIRHTRLNLLCKFGLVATLSIAAASLHAAEWRPTRPVLVLDGFAPGGGTDVYMRLMAPEIGKSLGQQVIVENKSGASGHLAAETVAHAAPNGQTVLIQTASMITSRPLYPKIKYDIQRDLAPVTELVRIPNVFVVHPALPVKNVREFVELAKKHPAEMIFGSTGLGSISHVGANW